MTCEKDEKSTTGAKKATLSCEIDEISKRKNNSLQLIDLSEVNNECNDEGINDSIITLGEIKLPTTSNNNSNQDSIEDNGTETAKGNSVYENIDMDDGEEEYTKIIKAIRGGTTYEIMYCSFCGKMITNHYCSAVVLGSKIRFENKKDEVCGKAMCLLCRSDWGDAEKYMSYCKFHHPDNHALSDATIVVNSQKKKPIANTRASDKNNSGKVRPSNKKQSTNVTKNRNSYRNSYQSTTRASTRASKRARK